MKVLIHSAVLHSSYMTVLDLIQSWTL